MTEYRFVEKTMFGHSKVALYASKEFLHDLLFTGNPRADPEEVNMAVLEDMITNETYIVLNGDPIKAAWQVWALIKGLRTDLKPVVQVTRYDP